MRSDSKAELGAAISSSYVAVYSQQCNGDDISYLETINDPIDPKNCEKACTVNDDCTQFLLFERTMYADD